jgi:hypothetical protein
MLGLPKSTELSKQLPKKAIYEKFNMNTAAKERFDADISRINIVAEISENTVSIAKGETVSVIFVLQVILKHKDFDPKTISQISKLIDQNMLLVLDCDGERKLAIHHTKLLQTDWKPADKCCIALTGLNLDTVWENLITQVGSIEIEDGNSLDKQIAADEQKAKLEKEIARLEKLARAEKQPKKKFELVQEINRLKKNLSNTNV